MATELIFNKEGSRYIASFTSSGSTTVQIDRESKDYLTVYANIEGMNKVSIFNATIYEDFIFDVDVPEGVVVTIESGIPVVKAMMI